ncbi:MAG: aroA [Gammaproteobacteria bacterium]|nr:aroA [Gammaproteobacteria bacterium]
MSNSTRRIDYLVKGAGPLQGHLRIPGDKSISHRALMLAAIAEGSTHVSGFLDGADTLATMQALQAMGVVVDRHGPHELTVHGVGLHGLQPPAGALYLGNSGTSVRLLSGLLAGQKFDTELTGDASLSRRPMRRVVEPLRQMQADIECTEAGTLPIHIRGGRQLTGITYTMPVASAQLKSALLLAGLYASGRTCVIEPAATRDHTERMLTHFGCRIEQADKQICLSSQKLMARDIEVPADISSATFFLVAAAITAGSDLYLEKIGVNPTRHAVLEILQAMGADITLHNQQIRSGEPVADIRVRSGKLQGIAIPESLVPIAIDEFPAILIAAACASGTTRLSGAAELRVKESDRIQALASGLQALGIQVQTSTDGMLVEGGKLSGGVVDSCTDHRIAMAFTVAGLVAAGPVTVQDCVNVNTSFPGFIDLLRQVGCAIEVRERDYA